MGRIVLLVVVAVVAVLVYNWASKPMVIYWTEHVDYYGMASKHMECSWVEGDVKAVCDGNYYALSPKKLEWLSGEVVKARK